MTRARTRALVFATLLTILTLVGTVSSPRPAAAYTGAATCQRDGGIYLYIFYEGSPVTEGCTSAGNAFQRIQQVAALQTSGSGFICQIAGLPGTCQPPDPSTQVYWTFWWWQGAGWQYATVGGGYPGVPGSVEAWHYSAAAPPPVTPPAPAAPEPVPPAPAPVQPAPVEPPAQPAPVEQPAQQPAAQEQPPADATRTPDESTAPAEADAAEPTESPVPGTAGASDPPSADASDSRSPDRRSPSPGTGSPTPATAEVAGDSSGGMPWATVGTLSAVALGGAGYGVWNWRKKAG